MSDDTIKRRLGTALIQDLADNLCEQAQKVLGIKEDRARAFGDLVAGMVADNWGGQIIYVPKDQRGLLLTRNLQIYKEYWEGLTIQDLIEKYDLSQQRIYSILEGEKVRRRQKQHSLLDV